MKNNGGVRDGTRYWSSAIQSRGERDHAILVDLAAHGFESHNTAKRGGNADGAARIGADAGVAETRSNAGCGASAGTARNASQVPRIVRGAEMRIVRSHAVGELVHVGFAEEDRAGFL